MKDFKSRFVLLEILVLAFIVLFGAFFYTHKLGEIPAGFYVDEAVTGYNAYSILLTGKDEYGKPFPIAMRFFGSYSPPLYTFLTIPFIHFFGPNIASVRFVSVVCGILEIIVFFFILKKLRLAKSKYAVIITTAFFAITPWVIFFSRVGYEMYLGFLLFSIGILFTWLGLTKPKFLVAGFAFLSLSTYGAHTERYLVPLFILGFLVMFRKDCFDTTRRTFLCWALFIALLVQIPHLSIITTPSLFSKSSLFYSDILSEQARKINFLPFFISFLLSLIREFLAQFVAYFSPRSLFFLGDPDPQRSIPEIGPFYSWMVIPYLVGFFVIWKNWREKAMKFLIFLMLITLVPVALTKDPFSTQRALPVLLPLSLVVFLGIDRIIKNMKLRLVLPFFIILLSVSIISIWRGYFVLLLYERAKIWGYGFRQLAEIIKMNPDREFVIDQTRTKPVYIELAFYLAYPPEKFQESVGLTIKENYYQDLAFDTYRKFGNIETRNIRWEADPGREQILVGDALAISKQQAQDHSLTQLFEIKDPLGEVVFRGFETNPSKISTN